MWTPLEWKYPSHSSWCIPLTSITAGMPTSTRKSNLLDKFFNMIHAPQNNFFTRPSGTRAARSTTTWIAAASTSWIIAQSQPYTVETSYLLLFFLTLFRDSYGNVIKRWNETMHTGNVHKTKNSNEIIKNQYYARFTVEQKVLQRKLYEIVHRLLKPKRAKITHVSRWYLGYPKRARKIHCLVR